MNWFTTKRHEREVALQDGAEEIDFEAERLLNLAIGGAVVLTLGAIALTAGLVLCKS